ncbi:MAG TPA: hypothetical protein PLZ86_01925 [bacterium]|nr:hypothetical protein [bacterium]
MPLDLASFGVMQYLWDTLDKTADGAHIRYTIIDVEQLWWMGFVDTQRVSLEEWTRIFDPYLQKDGSYLLNRDQFLSLEDYRYKGEIRIPFDARLINEGKYTDDGLEDLIEASIAPSCGLPPENLNSFFAELKEEFRQSDGLILIEMPAKLRIKALIDEHPSPLRNLEVMLDGMLASKGPDMMAEVGEAKAGAATAQAAIQASRFSAKPTTRAEEKAKGLEALQKSRRPKASGEVDGVDKVEVRKIRRSRKGVRG